MSHFFIHALLIQQKRICSPTIGSYQSNINLLEPTYLLFTILFFRYLYRMHKYESGKGNTYIANKRLNRKQKTLL